MTALIILFIVLFIFAISIFIRELGKIKELCKMFGISFINSRKDYNGRQCGNCKYYSLLPTGMYCGKGEKIGCYVWDTDEACSFFEKK